MTGGLRFSKLFGLRHAQMKNILLIAILSLCVGCTNSDLISKTEIQVIDGDSIRYQGENVRLKGYNTPEIGHAECAYERNLGNKAKSRLATLIQSSEELELSLQHKRNGELSRDKYGRLLGSLYLNRQNVANIMVREQLAEYYDGTGQRRSWC